MPEKILPVKYLAQNDNELWDGVPGDVQCAPTSYTALALFLRPDKFDLSYEEPESYYKAQFESMGFTAADRGNHSAHVETLAKCFDIQGTFETALTPEMVEAAIDAGNPVVMPVNYKIAGHVPICVGYTDEGLVFNDCYGIRAGSANYYTVVNPGYGDNTGEHDLHTWELLVDLAFGGNGNEGWGFIVEVSL